MMKTNDSMKELENQAAEALKALFEQIPSVELKDIKLEPPGPERGIDILARIKAFDRQHMLVCEVKANGQPRHVRTALLQLREHVANLGHDATPIFIAPYLSVESQALCQKYEVGFLDLQGNARVIFDGVFIERRVANTPPAERRELKSLFKPKAAQILLVMLREPERAWRVSELAEAADVSLGHVSNVRTALLDREWATVTPDGLSLVEPEALLDGWRDEYEEPAGKRLRFYTSLHGSAFEDAAREALRGGLGKGQAVLASFSAAHWLAPYGRIGTHSFYADDAGLARLKDALMLSSASKGENVVVIVPKDRGPLYDTVEPAPGIVCTSPVRTYLDLTVAGERGREAADHLRRERLKWSK